MKVETFFTLSFSVSHTFFILLAPAVRESGDRFLTSRETFEKNSGYRITVSHKYSARPVSHFIHFLSVVQFRRT